ncbi:hypothetical protein [Flavobacterium sp. H122]|uniref:hypothetical protein n=1 Tax=Flavobacterium sp. H122 TaxID=2529860 RepID=UPI0010A9B32E|nr:hypothetical protein [Flavobacterium sp. H122]
MKDYIIELIYKTIKKPYQLLFKNKTAWNLNISDYINCPDGSIGKHLGLFLKKNNYSIQPQLEEHDVFHVITNSGTTVKEEIKMQFYLLGNGKRSPFVFIVISAGFFYPLNYTEFIESYKKGTKANKFYHLDYSKLLTIDLKDFQTTFNIK